MALRGRFDGVHAPGDVEVDGGTLDETGKVVLEQSIAISSRSQWASELFP